MQTKLKGLWEKVKGFFAKLNKKTRILLGACLAVLVVAIAAVLLLSSGKKEYALLYAGLTPNETSTVVQYLSAQGITDYRIQNDSILVPAGREMQLQADLAMNGFYTSGFNYDFYTENTGSFSTNAERQEAMRIATEQRLAATIRLIDGIRDAQVGITPGTERVYVLQSNATPATAWVLVTPESNQPLSDGVVKAIRNLVSHSEKNLDIESVAVEDTYGNQYDDKTGVGTMVEANALQRQFEQETNNKVRGQVLEALSAVYGEDNVKVAVNTTVDMSRKVVESTEYSQPEGSVDGGGLIGKEKWFWGIGVDGTTAAGGTVGTPENSDIPLYPNIVPNGTEDAPYSTGQGEREHNVDVAVTQQEILAGRITDVSVAVTINRNARNAETMTIEQLTNHVAVASGIGTSVEGWDSRVSIAIAPFDRDDTVDPGTPGQPGILAGVPDWMVYAAIAGIVLFIILLILILLLRRRSKKKKLEKQLALEAEMRAAEEAAAEEAAAAIIAAAPPTGGADIMEVNTEKSMELRKNVRQFAQNNPEIAAQMVKAWLKGEDTSG
ncbi:MAG: flagellar M-ring protein FliF [Lawsonibacter sp.]|nr:flagellar M-ring protein FliF [Lawsonibacter sp.]